MRHISYGSSVIFAVFALWSIGGAMFWLGEHAAWFFGLCGFVMAGSFLVYFPMMLHSKIMAQRHVDLHGHGPSGDGTAMRQTGIFKRHQEMED